MDLGMECDVVGDKTTDATTMELTQLIFVNRESRILTKRNVFLATRTTTSASTVDDDDD